MRAIALLLPTICLATPLIAQETRFTRDIPAGKRFELTNINGSITLTQGTSHTLEVVATKKVKRGSGDKVRAILEEENGVVRVCTLDQDQHPGATTCNAKGGGKSSTRNENEVEMTYTVTVPAGVTVAATTVNGGISAKAITRADHLTTVNGTITFTGEAASALNTVNGSIDATLSATRWTGSVGFQTVNGSVTVSLPTNADLAVSGQTVTGNVHSDFAQVTSASRFGPKSLKGQIGQGGRSLELQTVTGSVNVIKR